MLKRSSEGWEGIGSVREGLEVLGMAKEGWRGPGRVDKG